MGKWKRRRRRNAAPLDPKFSHYKWGAEKKGRGKVESAKTNAIPFPLPTPLSLKSPKPR